MGGWWTKSLGTVDLNTPTERLYNSTPVVSGKGMNADSVISYANVHANITEVNGRQRLLKLYIKMY